VRGDLEPRRRAGARGAAAGVQGDDEHLGAEPVRDLRHQCRPGDGGGVDADLVGPGAQQPVDVGDAADATAHGERDEDLLGGARHDVVGGVAAVGRGGDVEEGELVRALGVVAAGQLDGVPGVAQVGEVDALDDPAGLDVQAGDDADGDAHGRDPGGGGAGAG
jgi:hypothetical protein